MIEAAIFLVQLSQLRVSVKRLPIKIRLCPANCLPRMRLAITAPILLGCRPSIRRKAIGFTKRLVVEHLLHCREAGGTFSLAAFEVHDKSNCRAQVDANHLLLTMQQLVSVEW